MTMNQAAMKTKIHRSIECARGVPESRSGRRSLNEKRPATVAIARPLWLSTWRLSYTAPAPIDMANHNRRTRGSPDLVSLSTVIAQTIASARSGDRPGPS
jgi:hypothetical protein